MAIVRYLMLAAAVFALPHAVLQAQDADASSEAQKLAFAKEKYVTAVWGLRYAKGSCPGGPSKVYVEAASVAADHYGKIIDAAGESGSRFAFNAMTMARVKDMSCHQFMQAEDLRMQINKLGLLVDELLLAVHFSNIESCGIYDAAKWAPLKERASLVVPIVKTRPDASFVEFTARALGGTLAVLCNDPDVSSSPEVLERTTLGPFLREAVEFVNAPK
ncbi:MAG: hypothetical protein H6919_13150 [Sphingomonadaceae bacterium]|nr:hypothetical protein [Sphingomonadaceae bacterium]MCP5394835.1 hypothetical protein [Sphingomonadaceae bacterium]